MCLPYSVRPERARRFLVIHFTSGGTDYIIFPSNPDYLIRFMNVNEWTVVITVITTSVISVITAITVWINQRDKRRDELKLKELAAAKEQKEAEYREAEAAHRRKMEELQMVAIRQGGMAAKEAQKAKKAAIQGMEEVTQKIDASQTERREQMAKVIEINTTAIETANGVNEKIRSLGEEIQSRQPFSEINPIPVTVTNFPAESHET